MTDPQMRVAADALEAGLFALLMLAAQGWLGASFKALTESEACFVIGRRPSA